jgi:enolase|tara:strand:- start:5703 stop:6920 length:1218 start_codon:yes stop_codon:yes gene_type:complete
MTITELHAREIIDSRGNPTVEVEVWDGKKSAIAAAPSGASTGANEVLSFPKTGVSEAISMFNSEYFKKFIGAELDFHETELLFKRIDPEFQILGGNLAIALSLAVAKLNAVVQDKEFYQIFGTNHALPFPLGNVLGGGAHAGKGSPDFQEFLALPTGARTIRDAIMANETVHKTVLELIYKKIPDFTRGRNDEGGWAPKMGNEEALEILVKACKKVSESVGFDIKPGMDIAATQFWDKKKKVYSYRKGGTKTSEQQIDYMEEIVNKHGIYYLEDPFVETDFDSFTELTKRVGKTCLVVADDLTVTNPAIFEKCIKKKSANAIIVKPNQVGSLTDTEKVINRAIESNYTPVVSHRSGETADTSIAHIAVGFSVPILKTGVTGGERVAKLDELIRISENTQLKMSKI